MQREGWLVFPAFRFATDPFQLELDPYDRLYKTICREETLWLSRRDMRRSYQDVRRKCGRGAFCGSILLNIVMNVFVLYIIGTVGESLNSFSDNPPSNGSDALLGRGLSVFRIVELAG